MDAEGYSTSTDLVPAETTPGTREWLQAIPAFGKLFYRLARDPRIPRRNKLIFGGVAAYLLVPFDLIPDWIPGVGQLEDLAMLIVAVDGLLNRVDPGIVEEHWDGDPKVLESIRGGLAKATEMVPDRVKRRIFLRSQA